MKIKEQQQEKFKEKICNWLYSDLIDSDNKKNVTTKLSIFGIKKTIRFKNLKKGYNFLTKYKLHL